MAAIESAIFNPSFGLEEIKSEIINIESILTNPSFGLEEIKSEVAAIESAIFNPSFGLEEIKSEIRFISSFFGLTQNLTTGPFKATSGARLFIKVLNNTTTPKTITVNVYRFNPTTGVRECVGTRTVTIPGCTVTELSTTNFNNNDNLEVQFLGMMPGIYGYVTSATADASMTFRSGDLLPIMGDCVPTFTTCAPLTIEVP